MSFHDMNDLDQVLSECTKANYYKRMGAIRENFELAKNFKSPEMVLEKFLFRELGIFPALILGIPSFHESYKFLPSCDITNNQLHNFINNEPYVKW